MSEHMSRLSLCIFLLLTAMQGSAQKVSLKGKVTNARTGVIYLYRFNNFLEYQKTIVDSAVIDKNGTFSMSFSWEKPLPAQLGDETQASPLFLSPGYDLQVTFDSERMKESIAFTGKGAEVNAYLAHKTLHVRPFYSNLFKMPEPVFTATIDSSHAAELSLLNDWFKNNPKKDAATETFIRFETAEINYSWGGRKLMYPGSYAYYTNQQAPLQLAGTYYDFMKQLPVDNPDAITSTAYLAYLETYTYDKVEKKLRLAPDANRADEVFALINAEFRGETREYLYAKWIYALAVTFNDVQGASTYLDRYKTFATNKVYVSVLDRAIGFLGALLPGRTAPDFLARDLEGKPRKLSDYRGSLVYVDVWASWCGPCLREIPYMEKLQEELKGKKITFLVVSVDENQDAWKNTIKARNIGGTHLVSNGSPDSDVSSLYRINGIPHYIIIDKDGKIVNSNARRPSQGVREDLEKLLN